MHPRPAAAAVEAGAPNSCTSERSVRVRDRLKSIVHGVLQRQTLGPATPAAWIASTPGLIVIRSPRSWARPVAASLALTAGAEGTVLASVEDSDDNLVLHLLAAQSRLPVEKLARGPLVSNDWIALTKAASALHDRTVQVCGRVGSLGALVGGTRELEGDASQAPPRLCIVLGVPGRESFLRQFDDACARDPELTVVVVVTREACQKSWRMLAFFRAACSRLDVSTIVDGPGCRTEGLALRGELCGVPFSASVPCWPEWHLVDLAGEIPPYLVEQE